MGQQPWQLRRRAQQRLRAACVASDTPMTMPATAPPLRPEEPHGLAVAAAGMGNDEDENGMAEEGTGPGRKLEELLAVDESAASSDRLLLLSADKPCELYRLVEVEDWVDDV